MKKKIIGFFILLGVIFATALAFSSCATYHSCPTYSYKTLNKTTGEVTTNTSNVLYYPGDVVVQMPDMTKFVVLDVTLTNSHYKRKL